MSAGGMSARELAVDAVVAAPPGCTRARNVVEGGRPVFLTDCQCNLDAFSLLVGGHLHAISMPTSQAALAGYIAGNDA